MSIMLCVICLFQAEDGIRDLVRSRGLGDVYKRQVLYVLGRMRSSAPREAATPQAGRCRYRISTRPMLSLIHI